jgi:hypothetical protein
MLSSLPLTRVGCQQWSSQSCYRSMSESKGESARRASAKSSGAVHGEWGGREAVACSRLWGSRRDARQTAGNAMSHH